MPAPPRDPADPVCVPGARRPPRDPTDPAPPPPPRSGRPTRDPADPDPPGTRRPPGTPRTVVAGARHGPAGAAALSPRRSASHVTPASPHVNKTTGTGSPCLKRAPAPTSGSRAVRTRAAAPAAAGPPQGSPPAPPRGRGRRPGLARQRRRRPRRVAPLSGAYVR